MPAYRQLGVYPEVTEVPELITVPGGVRVPVFIGKGKRDLTKVAEKVIRGTGEIDTLSKHALSIIKVYSTTVFKFPETSYKITDGKIDWSPSAGETDPTIRPPTGSEYFVDYTYPKGKNDIIPKLFFSLEKVKAEYGEPNLANSLSLASAIAFEQGTSIVGCMQLDPTSVDVSGDFVAFKEALLKLENFEETDIVVPLFGDDKFILGELKPHVEKMSSLFYSNWRIGIAGLDGVTADITVEKAASIAEALKSKRVALVYPGSIYRVIEGVNTLIPGYYMAAAVAGISTSAMYDSAEPLSMKTLAGFTTIPKDLLRAERNYLASKGVLVIQTERGINKILHATTTDVTTPATQEVSVVTSSDEVRTVLKQGLEPAFIGRKAIVGIELSINAAITTLLRGLVTRMIIADFADIKVQRSAVDPRTVEVYLKVLPMWPVNWIDITIALTPIL